MTVKFPDVTVQLTGKDGNAMSIIGRVRQALARAGKPEADIVKFTDAAMSEDYDNVLQTAMKTVNCL